jgi:predicted DNA-binding mobile mystery protein A
MVREALAMPAAVLAERLGVADTTVLRLEESERLGTAQLNTLRRAADALDCELVYAFVPRRSLEEQVLEQARARAEAEVRRIAHSMALEDQAVSARETESLIEARIQEWLAKPGLWDRV